MADRSMTILAIALFGLLGCQMTVALSEDTTLLTTLPEIITVWTNATSCNSQLQSDVDFDAARINCTHGVPQVQAGNNSNIVVYWRGRTSTDVNVTAPLAATTSIMLKACYSLHSTKDRKWRKKKDPIGKDKQCFKKLIETQPWPTLDKTPNQIVNYTWTIPDNIGKATYFFRVFAYNSEGQAIGYGDSSQLLEADFIHQGMTISPLDGNYGIGYWKVKGYDGLTSGVIIGVVILSTLAWVLLISYFVYEHFIQKDD